MPRRARGLSAAFVDKGTKPGRFADGNGLYLLVRSREAKFWLFRYTHDSKTREMGLGPAFGRSAVTLAAARIKARELHDAVRAGRDPLEERDVNVAKAKADAAKAQARTITFAQVADMYLAAHERGWRDTATAQHWRGTLRNYVLPVIGDIPVGQIDNSMVMQIVEPLWRSRTETGARVRARVENMLDYAKVRGWRDGENPARWRGHLAKLLPPRHRAQRVRHHPALAFQEIGTLIRRLREDNSTAARCVECLILTAARSTEMREARWCEIDLERGLWIVPAERMKAEREHRVALSAPAIELLRKMATQFGDDPAAFVFPGYRDGRPLSDKTLLKPLHDAGVNNVTIHGFRSTFRDWCGEQTNFAREVAEAALAHVIGDQTERAYARGDLFERRRRLMQEWATFCNQEEATTGKVLTLKAAG